MSEQVEQQNQPEKVTFSPAQQERLNELIRDAMGRAGREARAESAELRVKIEALNRELEVVKTERTNLENEAKTSKEQALLQGKQNLLLSLAAKHGFVAPEQGVALLKDKIQFNEEKKRYIVLGDDGKVLSGPTGEPISADDFVKGYAATNPNLIRSEVRTGVGSAESREYQGTAVTDAAYLRSLFGRGSDARLANDLAKRDQREYRRLKAEARRQGLIP